MSRLNRPLETKPGPECFCGAELKSVRLPADLAVLSGRTTIWVHTETGDTRCYPNSANPKDAAATGEPADV
jgi:hypothetical protein